MPQFVPKTGRAKNQANQRQHQRRDLRVGPNRGENPMDDQSGVAKRFRRKWRQFLFSPLAGPLLLCIGTMSILYQP